MIGAFCIEFGVLQVTCFWSIEEVVNPKVSIKEVMVRFALIEQEGWLAFCIIWEMEWPKFMD